MSTVLSMVKAEPLHSNRSGRYILSRTYPPRSPEVSLLHLHEQSVSVQGTPVRSQRSFPGVHAWAILWWVSVSVAVLPYLDDWLVHHPDCNSFCFGPNAVGLQNNCRQVRTRSILRHSASQVPTSSGSGWSCSSRIQGSIDSSKRLQSILPSLHVFL